MEQDTEWCVMDEDDFAHLRMEFWSYALRAQGAPEKINRPVFFSKIVAMVLRRQVIEMHGPSGKPKLISDSQLRMNLEMEQVMND